MKITGIIAEYNPFHNGHLYHLEKARRETKADYLVVVMSGDFTQRGAPALVDKFIRAQMALTCGADLVLELPVIHAVGSAAYFARGAVALLHNLQTIDCLCFGSEDGTLEAFEKAGHYSRSFPSSEKNCGRIFPWVVPFLWPGIEPSRNVCHSRFRTDCWILRIIFWVWNIVWPFRILLFQYVLLLSAVGNLPIIRQTLDYNTVRPPLSGRPF